jgi:hypothetical protein
VFGLRGEASRCQCQRYKLRPLDWDSAASVTVGERARRLRRQTGCGQPESATTSGLVAYLDGEPVGWCAFEPRSAYRRTATRRPCARGVPDADQARQEVTWGELHVGSGSIFAAAGFAEVNHPTLRRVVMRIDF